VKVHRHLIDAAIEALRQILADKHHADQVVADFFERHPKWGSRDRRMFAETVYDLVRWWRWYDFLAGGDTASTKPSAERVARVWAAYWLERGGELPDFIDVDGVTRESLAARKELPVTRAIRASVPDWFDARGEQELGDQWPAILDALNTPAPVFLRANRLRVTPAQVAAALAREDIEAVTVPGLPDALRLESRRNLRKTRAYTDGLFEIQDANSQRIVPLLDVAPGMTVVDACAGAGGKSLQLAAAMAGTGRLVAMDIHQPKLDELRRRAKRAGVTHIETRTLKPDTDLADLAGTADRVLLDVPCSGSGVLRRTPDAKWKLRPGDLERLCQTQAEILRRHAALVRPGGALVYATCSIFPSENTSQVHRFLAENPAWSLEDEQQLIPEPGAGDGFYAARLRRPA
jgi:16S rRNA (cytosine967-C5)-methyltransferase